MTMYSDTLVDEGIDLIIYIQDNSMEHNIK